MKQKKAHEVQQICPLIDSKWKESNIDTVVDIGAGQGFISHVSSITLYHSLVFSTPLQVQRHWCGNTKAFS